MTRHWVSGMAAIPLNVRFESRIDRSGECWLWMTTLVRRGLATDELPKRPGAKGVSVTVFSATPKGREVARGC